jgi:hypothetical protein
MTPIICKIPRKNQIIFTWNRWTHLFCSSVFSEKFLKRPMEFVEFHVIVTICKTFLPFVAWLVRIIELVSPYNHVPLQEFVASDASMVSISPLEIGPIITALICADCRLRIGAELVPWGVTEQIDMEVSVQSILKLSSGSPQNITTFMLPILVFIRYFFTAHLVENIKRACNLLILLPTQVFWCRI